MKLQNEDALSVYLKENRLLGVCLLYGDEPYLIESWRNHILKGFGGEEGFNFQRLDGGKPDLDLLYDATQALPLFAAEKCVLMDRLDISKLSADEIAKLSDIFADCPAECLLLVTTVPEQFDAKSANGKKVVAAAEQYGCGVALSVRPDSGLVKFLQGQASLGGCSLSSSLAKDILGIVGSDMLTLSREMEKLCAYAGSGELVRSQVDAVVIPKTEAKVFDLSRCITAGNGQRAMELVRDLFSLREAPVAILATLAMAYADLYRARIARDQGIAPSQVISMFGYKGREFRINNAYKSPLSTKALRKSLEMLAGCDCRMKSTGADGRLLLEQTVAGLLAVRGL